MIAYLKKRAYPIGWVEMDEEADGQYYMPEDYAALYIQFADAIHKVDPTLKLGGPVFQGINQDVSVWPDARGNKSWFGRFYEYLKSHGRHGDLSFASFEIYPYEACTMKWDDLYRNRELTRKTLQAFRDDGLPPSIPLMNTESNLSGSLLKAVAGPDIFLERFAWSHSAANSMYGTAQTHTLTPIPTCRLWFRHSTPLDKLCSRSPKLPSPFCAAKSPVSRLRRNSSRCEEIQISHYDNSSV